MEARVAISTLAVGGVNYALAARQALASCLEQTPFEIHLSCEQAHVSLLPRSPRIQLHPLDFAARFRADGFLAKLHALRSCLSQCDAEIILHLDADAVLRLPLRCEDLERALGSHGLAMVEQKAITGSTMSRADFLQHYIQHALAYIAPAETPPSLDAFRFFNSGVILFRREELRAFLDWAEARLSALPAHHEVGIHMIADQDYLQVWANNVRPGSCAELPWFWNHCAHWDDGFPREEALVAHLSNFCNGPTLDSIAQLRQLRQKPEPADAPAADVTFIVVTHNSARHLAHCLDAIEEVGARTLLVDNASSDGTLEIAARPGVQILRNPTNEGFAAAANRGTAQATSRYLCFLNPDCSVTPEVVASALAELQINPRALAVPNYVDWDGRRVPGRQPGYSRRKLIADIADMHGRVDFVQWMRAFPGYDDTRWHWPLAACLFVTREWFEALGGFDTRYFCYMEDVALGLRAARAGGETVALPETVLHLRTQGAEVDSARRIELLDTARIQFAEARYGRLFAASLRLLQKRLQSQRKAPRAVPQPATALAS